MKIEDLKPPVTVPEPAWKRQLVEFWQQADDHRKLDLEVTLKMGDAAGARRVIESWQQELEERRKKKASKKKKKTKQRVRYGYGGYWYPGTAYAGQDHPSGAEGGDGGGESIREAVDHDAAIQQFFSEIVDDLDIAAAPKMHLHHDSGWSEKHGTFGRYDPANNTLELAVTGRHLMDIVRTMAHELVHCRQNEIDQLPGHAGETGSPWEDEANAVAGRILRGVAARHPELFKHDVVESSGYIPTEREKNDPRFVMALSPDVRPGATGKNANKLGLKTGKQGEPTPLMKNLRNALREFKETGQLPLTEDRDLFEIDMSPSNLRKLVRNIDARAGIEFEMIIPNINTEEEGELEADYDMDERIRSIDDAVEFFDDGDYNSSRDIRNLREELNNEFYEWLDEQIEDKWQEEGRDYLRDYIHNNELYDGTEEDLETQMENSWDARDDNYDQARDEFREEFESMYDDGDWLNSAGYTYATDIERNFDVQWPHYTMTGGDAEMDIAGVAEDFRKMIDRPVNYSTSYHGGRREPGAYVIEPDGSLEGDEAGDGGLEFVSPPLPLDELLSDMEKVRAWAKERKAYTNSSTGLHMNVSVPDTSTAKLDYVKLALLLGDNYVLEQFGRAANTYAASALNNIRSIVQNDPDKASALLEKMRGHMEALATKAIHTGNTSKYTSINTKGNYVEFRSPGGDYLDANWDKVVPTLLRTVVALDAAMDPNKYREEYQKKLYKLLDSAQTKTASPNVNKLLSMYFTDQQEGGSRDIARKLAKELLTKRQAEREAKKGERDFWWSVTMPSGSRIEVVARTEQEAREKAARQWGFASAEYTTSRARVEALRPADSGDNKSGSGRWGIWITGLNKFASINKERLEFPSKQEASEWYQDRVLTTPGTRSDVEIREIPAEPAADAASVNPVRWGVWAHNWNDFLKDPNTNKRQEFDSVDAAQAWLSRYTQGVVEPDSFEVRRLPDPGAGNPAAEYTSGPKYYLHDRGANRFIHHFFAPTAGIRERELEWWRTRRPDANLAAVHTSELNRLGLSALADEYATRSAGDAGTAEPATPTQTIGNPTAGNTAEGNLKWYIRDVERDQIIHRFYARDYHEAVTELAWWKEQNPGRDLKYGRDDDAPAPAASQTWYVSLIGQPDTEIEIRSAANAVDATQQAQVARPGVFGAGTGNIRAARVPVATTPAAGTGEFTGEWRIVAPDGTEVHRFGGVGNVQADANRVAMAWLQRNPRHMIDGTEVVPVMSE